MSGRCGICKESLGMRRDVTGVYVYIALLGKYQHSIKCHPPSMPYTSLYTPTVSHVFHSWAIMDLRWHFIARLVQGTPTELSWLSVWLRLWSQGPGLEPSIRLRPCLALSLFEILSAPLPHLLALSHSKINQSVFKTITIFIQSIFQNNGKNFLAISWLVKVIMFNYKRPHFNYRWKTARATKRKKSRIPPELLSGGTRRHWLQYFTITFVLVILCSHNSLFSYIASRSL